MTLPIYNDSRFTLEALADKLPHAQLLDGPVGIGLLTIAKAIAGKHLATIIQPTDKDGAIDLQKGSIKAEQIRSLYDTTKGKARTRQVYIIDDADKMVATAQHSFLKLLEEPSPNTHFILTSHQPHQLLATVLSRTQRATFQAVATDQSRALIADLGVTDPKLTAQLLYLADGRPALLTRLIKDKVEFSRQTAYITAARQFLQGEPVQKLQIIQQYQNDRAGALQLIAAAQTILQHSLRQADPQAIITTADQLATIYDRIEANGNIRLQLVAAVV